MSELLPAVPARGARISADDVGALDRHVTENISQVDSVDDALEWLRQAAALTAYLRDKELQRPMLGAQRRTEARIGQLLGEPYSKRVAMTTLSDKRTRNDFRRLGRALAGECPLTQDEWRKSRRALTRLIRFRLGEMPDLSPLPDNVFRCIVADPPWHQDTGPDVFGGTGERGHDELAYPVMSVEAISALEVEKRSADDAHLYLWTTNRYLEPAYNVARNWGFKPSVVLVWTKSPRGVGLGDTFRLTTEFILFARRGNLEHRRIVPTSWFDWRRGWHSEKPAAFYDLVTSVTPGPYLDLFARTERLGWEVWGDEAAA